MKKKKKNKEKETQNERCMFECWEEKAKGERLVVMESMPYNTFYFSIAVKRMLKKKCFFFYFLFSLSFSTLQS